MKYKLMGWFAVALLSSIVVSAQTSPSTYYYYKGDSIYLPLNNQHFFAYVDTAKISLDELEQEYKVTEVAGASTQSYTKDKDTSGLLNYRYSVGADIGWFDGIMLKIQLKNNLYLQADVGMGLFFNFFALPISPSLTCDLGGQLNLLYEKKFPKRTNTYWIAGGGLYYAAVSPDGNTKKVNTMKGGVKAILGIEYFLGENLPLSLQVDMRIG